MDENEFDKIVEGLQKPVKYDGIDGFFAVIAVLIVLIAVPVIWRVWSWGFGG